MVDCGFSSIAFDTDGFDVCDEGFTDNFNDASIDDVWTEGGSVGTITEDDGVLTIEILNGENAAGANAPILHTYVIDDNSFDVSVKVTSLTNITNRSIGGLFLYGGGGDVNGIGIGLDTTTTKIWCNVQGFGSAVDGSAPVWFKIRFDDDIYYFEYSTDGTNYTTQYSASSLGFEPIGIGLYASNWAYSQPITISFDDFTTDYDLVIDKELDIKSLVDVQPETYSDWLWQSELVITGSVSGALTDYPVLITVDYDAEFMNSDFSDIRFGTDYGDNLSYFLRRKVDADYAEFWVKIPVIPASPDTITIYVYAGNDAATDQSNGFDTFTFFDDFNEEYTTGLDTTKWNVTDGYNVLTNGEYQLWSGFPMLHTHLYSKTTFGVNYTMGCKVKVPSSIASNNDVSFGFDNNSTSYIKEYMGSTTSKFHTNDGGSPVISDDHATTFTPTTYYLYEMQHPQGIDITEEINFTPVHTSATSVTTNLPVRFHTYGHGGTQGMIIDYVYVRQDIANEPIIGELGTFATTQHSDLIQALLTVPHYSNIQALLCIRPLREDFQALLNVHGYSEPLIQALLYINEQYTYNYIKQVQALFEVNSDASFHDAQAFIDIGNVTSGSLEIKGKVLYKPGHTTPSDDGASVDKGNVQQFVMKIGGRIYG